MLHTLALRDVRRPVPWGWGKGASHAEIKVSKNHQSQYLFCS